jgi:hypothetical protein
MSCYTTIIWGSKKYTMKLKKRGVFSIWWQQNNFFWDIQGTTWWLWIKDKSKNVSNFQWWQCTMKNNFKRNMTIYFLSNFKKWFAECRILGFMNKSRLSIKCIGCLNICGRINIPKESGLKTNMSSKKLILT